MVWWGLGDDWADANDDVFESVLAQEAFLNLEKVMRIRHIEIPKQPRPHAILIRLVKNKTTNVVHNSTCGYAARGAGTTTGRISALRAREKAYPHCSSCLGAEYLA